MRKMTSKKKIHEFSVKQNNELGELLVKILECRKTKQRAQTWRLTQKKITIHTMSNLKT